MDDNQNKNEMNESKQVFGNDFVTFVTDNKEPKKTYVERPSSGDPYERFKQGDVAARFTNQDSDDTAYTANGATPEDPTIESSRNTIDDSFFEPSQDEVSRVNEYQSHRRFDSAPTATATAAPQYITKKFFIICLIVVMIFTAAVSTAAAVLVTKNLGGSGSYSNLSSSSLSKSTGSKLTIQEICAKNEDAVVEINTSSQSTDMFGQTSVSEGAGSGVIVNKKGYIVTNYHVIEGANSISVTLHSGKSHKATIVGSDEDNDIAVLKINATGLTAATIGDSSKLQVGDMAVVIGNPLGQLGGTATQGIISALDRRLTIDDVTLDLLQTDAAINSGNSGGGLFNGAGELVGIVRAKSSGVGIEGLGFAIPINTVADEIDEIIEDGKVSAKPQIGISVTDVSEATAESYNLGDAGVYITDITSDNAEKAGFEKYDRVISFNGNKIESASDLISRVKACDIGDTVKVVVERDGQKKTIKVKLTESVGSSSSSSSSSQSQSSNSQGGYSNGMQSQGSSQSSSQWL